MAKSDTGEQASTEDESSELWVREDADFLRCVLDLRGDWGLLVLALTRPLASGPPSTEAIRPSGGFGPRRALATVAGDTWDRHEGQRGAAQALEAGIAKEGGGEMIQDG